MEHDDFPASSGHCGDQQLHPPQRAVYHQAAEAQGLPGLLGEACCTAFRSLFGCQVSRAKARRERPWEGSSALSAREALLGNVSSPI